MKRFFKIIQNSYFFCHFKALSYIFFSEFKIHRGHPIERQNYLDDLKKGKWTAPEEQPESQGSNPRGSQFFDQGRDDRYSSRQFSNESRERYQWTDRRPRAYLNRDSRWGNTDRNWPDQQNGIIFSNILLIFKVQGV